MKGFAGSQDLCEELTRSNPQQGTNKTKNRTSKRDHTITKDMKHTPEWDKKIQREFEAKNPGPPNRRLRKKTACINISDDEPEDPHGKMDDDWTTAIWDELVKDKPEHWDLHDALRLGKTCSEDPSNLKHHRTRSNSPSTASKGEDLERDADRKIYIDARDWEGKDLYKAVEDGLLTSDQAESIMRLRAAVIRDARLPHQPQLRHSGSRGGKGT